jgi:micrococcal nuclease
MSSAGRHRSSWLLLGVVLVLASCAAEADSGGGTGLGTSEEAPSPGTGSGTPGRVGARVTRVVDGDTFEAALRGDIVDVRMIGIDTPETVHPTLPVECFGPESAAFTERRLAGQRIGLEFDVERIDQFGRTLAYVWVGRRLFNEEIVRQGYATVTTFPPNVAHVERFVEAERKARRDGLGLWSACLRPVDTGADWRDLSDVG